MRDESAGIIQGGVQEGLHLAAAGALDVRPAEHVGLPDLVAQFGFELLVRRRGQQLPFRKAALFEETVQCGGGDPGCILSGRQRQFAQQGGTGAVRVLAFEAFDEVGELRRDGAGLPAVLARLRSESFEAAVAIAKRPIQQSVDRNACALGERNLVMASGNLLRTAGEFAAGQRLQNEACDQAVTEQRDFFSLGIHRRSSLSRTIRGKSP